MSRYKDNAREALARGYWVDGDGVVQSARGPRKTNTQKGGLLRFSIHFGDPRRRTNVLVHQLAALTLYGEKALAEDVRILHLNLDRTDNTPDNIALGTQEDAMRLVPQHDRIAYAINAASKLRRLTDAQVVELRAMRAGGATLRTLCERFGIAKSTASYVVNHRTY